MNLYTDRGRASEITVLFVGAKDSIAVPLSWKHLHSRKSLFGLLPFFRQFEYPPEDLQLAIYRRHLKAAIETGSDKGRNVLNGDFIQSATREPRELGEVLDSSTIVVQCVAFGDEARLDVGSEFLLNEIFKREDLDAVADTNLALCQRSFVRGFDLFGDAPIRLLGALAEGFPPPR